MIFTGLGDSVMCRTVWLFGALAVGTLLLAGCGTSASSPEGAAGGSAGACCGTPDAEGCCASKKGVFLCGGCGQVKGSDVCCAEGAEKCDKCGLTKGSPGCCKIEKGTDTKLCSKCGQIKGSDACCAEGAEKCDKCGLAKGSPGCCKIKK